MSEASLVRFLFEWNFRLLFSWTNGAALFRTKGIKLYHLIGGFGCQWAIVWVRINKKHGSWTSVVLDVLAEDLENVFFLEDDDNFIFLAAAAFIFAICKFNWILGYSQQTIATLPMSKSHIASMNILTICRNLSNPSCSKAEKRYPPDKSLSSRLVLTNHAIQWIVVYPSDSDIHPLNNPSQGPVSQKTWGPFLEAPGNYRAR